MGLAVLWRIAVAAAVVAAFGMVLFVSVDLAQAERVAVVCPAAENHAAVTCTVRRGGPFGALDTIGTFPLDGVDRTASDCEPPRRGRASRCAEGLWVARWTGPAAERADRSEDLRLSWVPFTSRRLDFPDSWRPGDAVMDARDTGTPVDVRVSTADPTWFSFPLQAAAVAAGIAAVSAFGLLVRRHRRRSRAAWRAFAAERVVTGR